MKPHDDSLDATLDRYVGQASAPPAGQVESSVDAVWERLRPEADYATLPARETVTHRSYFPVAAAVFFATVAIGLYSAQRSGLLSSMFSGGDIQQPARPPLSPTVQSPSNIVAPAPAPEPSLAFEVASIRQNTRTTADGAWAGSNGRFRAERASVRSVIGWAYGVMPIQVKGGPDWIERERYDFDASAVNPGVGPERMRTMVQTLLADRFKLRVRRESELAQVDIPPDLIAAVQEQLGLEVRVAKRQVDFVVIDSIERPSEN
jgi:hypothetical protein